MIPKYLPPPFLKPLEWKDEGKLVDLILQGIRLITLRRLNNLKSKITHIDMEIATHSIDRPQIR